MITWLLKLWFGQARTWEVRIVPNAHPDGRGDVELWHKSEKRAFVVTLTDDQADDLGDALKGAISALY